MLRQLNAAPGLAWRWTTPYRITARTFDTRWPRYRSPTLTGSISQRLQRRSATTSRRHHTIFSGAETTRTADKPLQANMSPPEKILQDYVLSSPIAKVSGLQQGDVDVDRWQKLGILMSKRLNQPPFEHAKEEQRARVYQYHLPVYLWLHRQLQDHIKSHPETPFFVGMSAPQGSGKTTICEELQYLLDQDGYNGVFASLDDFYLPHAQQQALAKANSSNKLLELRGNAGSHDTELARDTFEALHAAKADNAKVGIVRYDKSMHQGRGDRAAPEKWQYVQGPVDVVLFEGWMLGFAPLSEEEAQKAGEDITAVNHHLKGYKAALDNFVDAWFVVKVADPNFVYNWRLQAEHSAKKAGKPGMTDEQVADFVDRYMPGYIHYLPGLYAQGPTTQQPGKVLTIEIDSNRALVPVQPKQH